MTTAPRGTAARSTPYHSPLREEQAERTRAAILDALAEQLADGGLEEFSIPKVAARAGVAVRTVYRHFPTREALLEALSGWLDQRMGNPPMPRTAEEWANLPATLFPRFEQQGPLLEAQAQTRNGQALQRHARKRRVAAVERAMAPEADHLPPDEAKGAKAIFYLLASSSTWRFLHEVYGLDGDEAARAASWAQRLILDHLRRGRRREEKSERPTRAAASKRRK